MIGRQMVGKENEVNTVWRGLAALMLCILALMAASCGKSGNVKTAEGIVDAMARGDFKTATADFDGNMQAALPEEKLRPLWSGLVAQAGAFKERTATRESEENGIKTVYVTCQFERASLDARVVFDGGGKVTGLWIVPAQAAPGGK